MEQHKNTICTLAHASASSRQVSSIIRADSRQPRIEPWGCFNSPTSRSSSVVQLRALVILSPPLRGVCNGEPLRRSKTRHFTRQPVWNVPGMNEEAFKGQVKGNLGLTVDDVRRVQPMTGQSTDATPTTDFQKPAVEFFWPRVELGIALSNRLYL